MRWHRTSERPSTASIAVVRSSASRPAGVRAGCAKHAFRDHAFRDTAKLRVQTARIVSIRNNYLFLHFVILLCFVSPVYARSLKKLKASDQGDCQQGAEPRRPRRPKKSALIIWTYHDSSSFSLIDSSSHFTSPESGFNPISTRGACAGGQNGHPGCPRL